MGIQLFDYQKEVVEAVKNGKSVICNWSRGAGKDLTLAFIILEIRPSFILVNSKNAMDKLNRKIREVMECENKYKNDIKYIHQDIVCSGIIDIIFSDGQTVRISYKMSNSYEPHICFCINLPPLKKMHEMKFSPSTQYVFMITENNYDGIIEKKFKDLFQNQDVFFSERDIYHIIEYGLFNFDFIRTYSCDNKFYDEFAILSKKPDHENILTNDFKDQALKRLMKQFLDTPDTKDTVLTRKNIIEMIKDITNLNM